MAQILLCEWRMGKIKRLMSRLVLNGPADAKLIKRIFREVTNRYYAQGFNDGAEFMKRREGR